MTKTVSLGRALQALLLTGLAAGIAGCGNIHHIEVGTVPDDYRARHPILVAEAPVVTDLPVGEFDGGLAFADRGRVETVAARFRASGAETLQVLVPSGSRNAFAAERMAGEVIEILRSEGVSGHRILRRPYPVSGSGASAPVRLAYTTLKAQTGPCGHWPDDLGNTSENRNYYNFGCATQNNLAAQIADPRDLLSPRGVAPIDAGRRANAIGNYREQGAAPATQPSQPNPEFAF